MTFNQVVRGSNPRTLRTSKMAENLVNTGFSVIFMRSSQHHITPQERTGKRGKCVVKMVSRGKNVVQNHAFFR